MAFRRTVLTAFVVLALVALPVQSQLSYFYYERVCPQAQATIRAVVRRAIASEPRMGAALLRLHFHDCFVNGCDASILLDGEGTEKDAQPNKDSVRGYNVVDEIKRAVDNECGGSVVSCADILAVAARDSVVLLGGRHYKVPLGRRDSKQPFLGMTSDLPSPFAPFNELLDRFQRQGLGLKDLVTLSGAHTVGSTKCSLVRPRSRRDIDPSFANFLLQRCPSENDTPVPFDGTPERFDVNYYRNLMRKNGVLPSDQELFRGDGGESDRMVRYYSENLGAFWNDFGESMVRMGKIKPLTGNQGEIRRSCGRVNNKGSGGGGGGGGGGGYY